MKPTLFLLLLLAACAERPEAFRPVAVDVPVMAECKPPNIAKPPDLMAALPRNASLSAGMKSCLQQTLLDKGYEAELTAALQACR